MVIISLGKGPETHLLLCKSINLKSAERTNTRNLPVIVTIVSMSATANSRKTKSCLTHTNTTPWERVNQCWQPCKSEQTLNSVSISLSLCLNKIIQQNKHADICHTRKHRETVISACFQDFSKHNCLGEHMHLSPSGDVWWKKTSGLESWRALCVSALRWRGLAWQPDWHAGGVLPSLNAAIFLQLSSDKQVPLIVWVLCKPFSQSTDGAGLN